MLPAKGGISPVPKSAGLVKLLVARMFPAGSAASPEMSRGRFVKYRQGEAMPAARRAIHEA